MGNEHRKQFAVSDSDSRGLAADLAMVPLFAVGEIFLIGSFYLLHGTNIWSEREKMCREKSQEDQKQMKTNIPLKSFKTSSSAHNLNTQPGTQIQTL